MTDARTRRGRTTVPTSVPTKAQVRKGRLEAKSKRGSDRRFGSADLAMESQAIRIDFGPCIAGPGLCGVLCGQVMAVGGEF